MKIAPIGQVIGSFRLHDQGDNADPDNTGYARVLLSPGLELDHGALRLYGDVGFPVFEYVQGDQLVASVLYKLNLSYAF